MECEQWLWSSAISHSVVYGSYIVTAGGGDLHLFRLLSPSSEDEKGRMSRKLKRVYRVSLANEEIVWMERMGSCGLLVATRSCTGHLDLFRVDKSRHALVRQGRLYLPYEKETEEEKMTFSDRFMVRVSTTYKNPLVAIGVVMFRYSTVVTSKTGQGQSAFFFTIVGSRKEWFSDDPRSLPIEIRPAWHLLQLNPYVVLDFCIQSFSLYKGPVHTMKETKSSLSTLSRPDDPSSSFSSFVRPREGRVWALTLLKQRHDTHVGRYAASPATVGVTTLAVSVRLRSGTEIHESSSLHSSSSSTSSSTSSHWSMSVANENELPSDTYRIFPLSKKGCVTLLISPSLIMLWNGLYLQHILVLNSFGERLGFTRCVTSRADPAGMVAADVRVAPLPDRSDGKQEKKNTWRVALTCTDSSAAHHHLCTFSVSSRGGTTAGLSDWTVHGRIGRCSTLTPLSDCLFIGSTTAHSLVLAPPETKEEERDAIDWTLVDELINLSPVMESHCVAQGMGKGEATRRKNLFMSLACDAPNGKWWSVSGSLVLQPLWSRHLGGAALPGPHFPLLVPLSHDRHPCTFPETMALPLAGWQGKDVSKWVQVEQGESSLEYNISPCIHPLPSLPIVARYVLGTYATETWIALLSTDATLFIYTSTLNDPGKGIKHKSWKWMFRGTLSLLLPSPVEEKTIPTGQKMRVQVVPTSNPLVFICYRSLEKHEVTTDATTLYVCTLPALPMSFRDKVTLASWKAIPLPSSTWNYYRIQSVLFSSRLGSAFLMMETHQATDEKKEEAVPGKSRPRLSAIVRMCGSSWEIQETLGQEREEEQEEEEKTRGELLDATLLECRMYRTTVMVAFYSSNVFRVWSVRNRPRYGYQLQRLFHLPWLSRAYTGPCLAMESPVKWFRDHGPGSGNCIFLARPMRWFVLVRGYLRVFDVDYGGREPLRDLILLRRGQVHYGIGITASSLYMYQCPWMTTDGDDEHGGWSLDNDLAVQWATVWVTGSSSSSSKPMSPLSKLVGRRRSHAPLSFPTGYSRDTVPIHIRPRFFISCPHAMSPIGMITTTSSSVERHMVIGSYHVRRESEEDPFRKGAPPIWTERYGMTQIRTPTKNVVVPLEYEFPDHETPLSMCEGMLQVYKDYGQPIPGKLFHGVIIGVATSRSTDQLCRGAMYVRGLRGPMVWTRKPHKGGPVSAVSCMNGRVLAASGSRIWLYQWHEKWAEPLTPLTFCDAAFFGIRIHPIGSLAFLMGDLYIGSRVYLCDERAWPPFPVGCHHDIPTSTRQELMTSCPLELAEEEGEEKEGKTERKGSRLVVCEAWKDNKITFWEANEDHLVTPARKTPRLLASISLDSVPCTLVPIHSPSTGALLLCTTSAGALFSIRQKNLIP